jgi:hypothetical protein
MVHKPGGTIVLWNISIDFGVGKQGQANSGETQNFSLAADNRWLPTARHVF